MRSKNNSGEQELTILLRRNLETHTLQMEPLPLTLIGITRNHRPVAHPITIAVRQLIRVNISILLLVLLSHPRRPVSCRRNALTRALLMVTPLLTCPRGPRPRGRRLMEGRQRGRGRLARAPALGGDGHGGLSRGCRRRGRRRRSCYRRRRGTRGLRRLLLRLLRLRRLLLLLARSRTRTLILLGLPRRRRSNNALSF